MTQPAMSDSYAKMIVDAQLMCDGMRRIGLSPQYTTSAYVSVRMYGYPFTPEWADGQLAEAKRVLSQTKTEERT